MKMSKSQELVNWSKLPNALPKLKRLHLEEDKTDGLFYCPVQNCRRAVSPLDLSFATKFLAMYLFIDQKMFKTARKCGFHLLFLTHTSMQVLEGFINHIHPLLKPTCDYVFVTRNGRQHNKLGESISKLVFDATGKLVPSTCYQQIVETTSSLKDPNQPRLCFC